MRQPSLVLALALACATSTSAVARSQPAAVADAPDGWSATGARSLVPARAPYPAGVQRMLDEGRRECLAEGGTGLRYAPGIVRTGDLDADGRRDFVVDFRESRCIERPAMFNGTGGWDLVILVGRPRGAVREVFSGRVRDYTVLPGRGPKRITFALHGSYCGLAGADPCRKMRTITAQPFVFRER